VIDLPTQLRYFEEVRKSLAEKLGKKKAKELISEAIYFISVGINDYMGGLIFLTQKCTKATILNILLG